MFVLKQKANQTLQLCRYASLRRFGEGRIVYNKSQDSTASSSVHGNVPGLSKNVIVEKSEPLGPGAAKTAEYKNPEYFSYNNLSYFEAEIEMLKYRCPQPSAVKKQ